MVKIGFSTHTGNPLSALIRWLSGSSASHCWLLFEDTFFGVPMVMEASEVGFRLVPFENFKAEGNTVVALVEPAYSLDSGIQVASKWLGESYDFAGLFGAAFVMLGRWFKRKWKNPFASSKAMFCSEAIVYVMQAVKYPGSETMDPSATTPQDLLDFFAKNGLADAKLHSKGQGASAA